MVYILPMGNTETRELESGLVISLPGTESTGFSRAGELALRVLGALADRDQRKDGNDEDPRECA